MSAAQYVLLLLGVAGGYGLGLALRLRLRPRVLRGAAHPILLASVLGLGAAALAPGPARGPIEWPAEVTVLRSRSEYAGFLNAAGAEPGLVMAYATWCPACRAISPEVAQLAQSGRRIAVFNVSALPGLMNELGVEAYPAFFVVRAGKAVGPVSGLDTREQLEALLERGAALESMHTGGDADALTQG